MTISLAYPSSHILHLVNLVGRLLIRVRSNRACAQSLQLQAIHHESNARQDGRKKAWGLPLQRLDSLDHDSSADAQNLDPHLLDRLERARAADARPCAPIFFWQKLPHPGRLEAHVRVLAAGIGAGADGEDGPLDGLELGVRRGEDELEAL